LNFCGALRGTVLGVLQNGARSSLDTTATVAGATRLGGPVRHDTVLRAGLDVAPAGFFKLRALATMKRLLDHSTSTNLGAGAA